MKNHALEYHSRFPKGKTKVVPTKPTENSYDLSLAYSPGVAYPCLEIEKQPDLVYEYTNRGNLVGIITNGTAILGLGNIGASAGKPVMEGKAVLFKKFAGIDVFDIEINETDPEKFITIVKALEPTFGGINLEDIRAPECFHIEKTLDENMKIPVFHDDQHGTAIISTAALLNSLAITGKKAENLKVVINGAGAAAISIAQMLTHIGVKHEFIFMLDSRGVINHKRTNLHESKLPFVRNTDAETLADIFPGTDLFIGVSVANVVTEAMVKTMAEKPIMFALANPDPEIPYPDAKRARPDLIMATGRSDYPNQVNNVLGFPFIFRGALDVRAKVVNMEMKLAAAYALSELTKIPVPIEVCQAYNEVEIRFGEDYIIPKPLDERVLYHVAPAVAEAAVKTGVNQVAYPGREAYVKFLESIMAQQKEPISALEIETD
ncbi:malate dehydrogenase [Leptospira biflexa]|uniref:malic enzyme-like NAD(P)-binding protein n=1 Tax=Leptospira biflexa TaxID=172 RepID=UPI001083ECFF|nr:malic enzyme-like NAD(P)-binding protein [Leptospira biflexa]TGM37626.1 malate dehydrogenase [Leptospira biflexa]TGM40962.1 malate dehydrogenase [Leptospira biflexa]TGM47167.1 malate dehydrogenase [Leptospira biflexa]TGM50368.1 malate dehydrogenase [Leptospira biflexa]